MEVSEFIRAEIQREPKPGACCRVADDWVRSVRGFSPLERFGRPIKTGEDVDQWLSEFGGIAVGVNRVMRTSGFKKTTSPSVGDVGLVAWAGSLFMAIRTPEGWFSRSDTGTTLAPPDAVWKSWRIMPREE